MTGFSINEMPLALPLIHESKIYELKTQKHY